ncbi:MAG: CoA-binding protein [Nostoc sp. DedQUE01]|nr:CoA-binding protein [Nostoc sp. DedQUE11]MDZ8075512.1 CoA-binding protein [Nostoc sp. DedQUE01]MDZ8079733.1 CoA-binding protein [Nostoc sp. DcaGUA01]
MQFKCAAAYQRYSLLLITQNSALCHKIMPNLKEDDNALRQVLTQAKIIAVVGHSDKRHRTSYQIAQFLRQVGYTVYAVNPLVKEIDGKPSYAALEQLPEPVDIVNVFRRSEYLPEIVDEAIAVNVKTVWAQLGIWHQPSAQKALNAGLNVVMDACIKIEYLRLKVDLASDV